MDYTKINLHLLRIYAREIGVRSPSTCTKAQLIKKIKDIESGKVKPFFNKVGRPVSKTPATKEIKRQQDLSLKDCKSAKEMLIVSINIFKEFLAKLEQEIENME